MVAAAFIIIIIFEGLYHNYRYKSDECGRCCMIGFYLFYEMQGCKLIMHPCPNRLHPLVNWLLIIRNTFTLYVPVIRVVLFEVSVCSVKDMITEIILLLDAVKCSLFTVFAMRNGEP